MFTCNSACKCTSTRFRSRGSSLQYLRGAGRGESFGSHRAWVAHGDVRQRTRREFIEFIDPIYYLHFLFCFLSIGAFSHLLQVGLCSRSGRSGTGWLFSE